MAKASQARNAQQRKVLNLDTEKDTLELKQMQEGDRADLYEECDLPRYVRKMEPTPLRLGKSVICTDYDNTVAIKGNVIRGEGGYIHQYSHEHIKNLTEGTPSGVIITDYQKRTKRNKGWKALVLINADDSGWLDNMLSIVESFSEMDMPLVSFECLGQMFDTDAEGVAKLVGTGKLKLLDYTSDETIPFTDEEKKLAKKKDSLKKMKAPKLGFSIVGEGWHRSGTCLFQNAKGVCFIFGQDEGTYFGCELPEPVTTIQQAFECLTPKEVRGKPFQRQGEWFAVPVDKKQVPETKDCALQWDDMAILPLDDPDSNHHVLHTRDGRVGKDGKVYVHNCTVSHNDHADMELSDGWYTFYRNTAVRSVSQEGVD